MNEAELAAGLCLARIDRPSADLVARAKPGVAAALERSFRLPPMGLVADIAAMLEDPSPSLSRASMPFLDLRKYDDRVVGPLLMHRVRTSLADAYAGLPEAWRGAAVAALAERLVDELDPEAPWWEAGGLRRWLGQPDDEVWEHGLSALGAQAVRDALGDRLEAMIRSGTAHWTMADVHLVRNLPAMASRAQRVAVRQVLEAAELVDARLPRTVRPRLRTGQVASGLEEEDAYPTGGFSALSNSGSPENLVVSELVYMDDDHDDIDLFDVRFAEGELLYYTRDESIYTRERRRIGIALAADCSGARVKDVDLPFQRLVLALGVIHAVVDRVVKWLGKVELEIAIHPIGRDLVDETKLLHLVLRSQIDAGVVQIEPLADARAFAARTAERHRRSETDAVWITTQSGSAPELAVIPFELEIAEASVEQWVRAATALARHLA
ncbi:MAG: hypothetical protein AAF211_01880 [Myxococcota bacterium]